MATDMLYYDVEIILKIMYLRWNIENNVFRNLKNMYFVLGYFLDLFDVLVKFVIIISVLS